MYTSIASMCCICSSAHGSPRRAKGGMPHLSVLLRGHHCDSRRMPVMYSVPCAETTQLQPNQMCPKQGTPYHALQHSRPLFHSTRTAQRALASPTLFTSQQCPHHAPSHQHSTLIRCRTAGSVPLLENTLMRCSTPGSCAPGPPSQSSHLTGCPAPAACASAPPHAATSAAHT